MGLRPANETALRIINRMAEICRASATRDAALSAVHEEISRDYGQDVRNVVIHMYDYIRLPEKH